MSRAGFTLLEVLLVVAIVAMLFALAFTGWDMELDQAAMTAAADDMRAALARTRLEAIQSGRACRLVCSANGRYSAGPMATPAARGELEPDQSAESRPWTLTGQLPTGVRIQKVQLTGESAPAQPDEGGEPLGPDVDSPGFPPIVFQPDGTASSALIRLTGAGGRSVEIKLRGLIGQAFLNVKPAVADQSVY